MEGGSVAAYKAIRSHWHSCGYVRLTPPVQARGHSNTWSPSTRTRTRRFWRPRVRLTPKVKIFKFILLLRDGHMGVMRGFAKSIICTRGSGGGGYYRGRSATSYIELAGYGFGKALLKECDRKVIVEIYRTVIAAADGKLGSP